MLCIILPALYHKTYCNKIKDNELFPFIDSINQMDYSDKLSSCYFKKSLIIRELQEVWGSGSKAAGCRFNSSTAHPFFFAL